MYLDRFVTFLCNKKSLLIKASHMIVIIPIKYKSTCALKVCEGYENLGHRLEYIVMSTLNKACFPYTYTHRQKMDLYHTIFLIVTEPRNHITFASHLQTNISN
jgi:hypothetical protein